MIGVISPSSNLIGLLYLVTIICFIFALRFLSSPKHARRGNWIGGVGMILAIVSTLLLDGIGNWALIIIAAIIGSAVGLVGARKVKMTAMPQMVALFNGVGGGAAALVALAEFHIATAGLATTASTMPAAPIWLPRRAVAGFERKRSARMNVTIVIRYSRFAVFELTTRPASAARAS